MRPARSRAEGRKEAVAKTRSSATLERRWSGLCRRPSPTSRSCEAPRIRPTTQRHPGRRSSCRRAPLRGSPYRRARVAAIVWLPRPSGRRYCRSCELVCCAPALERAREAAHTGGEHVGQKSIMRAGVIRTPGGAAAIAPSALTERNDTRVRFLPPPSQTAQPSRSCAGRSIDNGLRGALSRLDGRPQEDVGQTPVWLDGLAAADARRAR